MASHRPRRIWRDNFEAMALALVVAVLLKYFVVEAYKIPTGSMQPTLMGWNDGRGGGLFDRVLVDKLSFHMRDPERFEVVVFQFPLDRSKYFVKRLVGMPGDHLRIAGGDLWVELPGPSGDPEWQVLRRPAGVQETHWLRVPTSGDWNLGKSPSLWTVAGDSLHASAGASASFPGTAPSIMDLAEHGYPPAVIEHMGRPKRGGGNHDVGDLRLSANIRPAADCSSVRLTLVEGDQRAVAVLPGPNAPADARVELHRSGFETVTNAGTQRLVADASTRVRFWNLDNRLEVEWDGEVVLTMNIDPAPRGDTQVSVESVGGGARFDSLSLDRDLYYDGDSGSTDTWKVPEGQYVVLGDNTLDSADSRAWKRITMHSTEGDFPGTISGQRLPDKNPMKLIESDHYDDCVFVDEWGERQRFRSSRVHTSNTLAPFVPRHLMRGRAVCVFWPWQPTKGIWRPSWVR